MRFPHSLRVLMLACLALSLGGCPDKKPKFPNCNSDKDCKDGLHCFNKTCSECSEDSHCESFEQCQAGSCVLRDGMCESDDDCTAGQVCKNNKCSACESDAECGADGRCSDGACLARGACNVDEDCADDEDCIEGVCKRPGREAPPELSCDLESVYFGFDEFSINEDAKGTLQSNSECIQQAEGRNVFLEGHTDMQGTEEYNIALSEKRGEKPSGCCPMRRVPTGHGLFVASRSCLCIPAVPPARGEPWPRCTTRPRW